MTSVACDLVLAFGMGKLQNQSNLLKYMGKISQGSRPDHFTKSCASAPPKCRRADRDGTGPQLSGISRRHVSSQRPAGRDNGIGGPGSPALLECRQMVLPGKICFPGRTGRGATDPINAALNYGYGILYGQIERCPGPGWPGSLCRFPARGPARQAQPDPRFHRRVSPGRWSTAPCLGLANKNVAFEQEDNICSHKETRRCWRKGHERLEAGRFEGKRHPLRAIMQMQARHVATFLRGERSTYDPFQMKW